MSRPYREPAEITKDIPTSPKKKKDMPKWIPKVAIITLSPFVVGLSHDLYCLTNNWHGLIVALGVFGAAMLIGGVISLAENVP